MIKRAVKSCFLVPFLFLILTLLFGRFAVPRSYSVDTNYCQYVQGVLFKRGVIHGGPEHFQSLSVHLNCMINPFRTGYASKYPPGYSALIAVGFLVGADKYINPVCGALTVLLLLLIVREHYRDDRTMFWASILSLVSTYFLYMSAEFWNHPSALLSCTVMVWAAFAAAVRPWVRGVAIVLALVYCSLTRPLSSLAMTLFLGGLLALRLIRKKETKSASFVVMLSILCGTVGGAVALSVYNFLLTGDPLLSGYEALHGPRHNPGFHVDPYGRDFTVLEGLRDLLVRWRSMNSWLFMWPIPSLSLLGIWLISFKKWRAFDLVCALWIVAQSFIYCFMWSAGQVPEGPRFLYECLPACIILSARGLADVEELLGAGRRARVALVVAVLGLSGSGFYRLVAWASL